MKKILLIIQPQKHDIRSQAFASSIAHMAGSEACRVLFLSESPWLSEWSFSSVPLILDCDSEQPVDELKNKHTQRVTYQEMLENIFEADSALVV